MVPQCVTSAYQIVFRGFVQPVESLLRYVDSRNPAQKPAIVSLAELKNVPGVFSRFTWKAKDVPGVLDPEDTQIRADFVGGCITADAGTCVERWNLDNGISMGEVALVPFEMTVAGPNTVGAGKLSVVGLDEDTVRITIVDFNPWYEASFCHFELSRLNMHLDLATDGSKPYAVDIGYQATGSGFALENGSIIFGQTDTARFTGGFKLGSATATPFDFTLDYSTDPATIQGTFGGVPASCTIDLDTFAMEC